MFWSFRKYKRHFEILFVKNFLYEYDGLSSATDGEFGTEYEIDWAAVRR